MGTCRNASINDSFLLVKNLENCTHNRTRPKLRYFPAIAFTISHVEDDCIEIYQSLKSRRALEEALLVTESHEMCLFFFPRQSTSNYRLFGSNKGTYIFLKQHYCLFHPRHNFDDTKVLQSPDTTFSPISTCPDGRKGSTSICPNTVEFNHSRF